MTSLYIHIPFCEHKCFYCSFPVSIATEKYFHTYVNYIRWEAQHYRNLHINTLYVGGGTPTYLYNDDIKDLLSHLRGIFVFSSDCEYTIEANPETIDLKKAQFLYDLGFNRVSLGVQSLNDSYLQFLGRRHNRECALLAFEYLRKAGFKNINVDMMYSFPGQTMKEIERDAKEIISLGSEHVSLYTLSIEKGSRFYVRNLKLENNNIRAEHYAYIVNYLENKGFKQYEISNFARSGKESRHNCNYWQGGDYVGLGMGAHSYINKERFWNIGKLHSYLYTIKNNKMPIEGRERLDIYKQFMEIFLINLRMNEGVDLVNLQKKFNCSLKKEQHRIIEQFVLQGLLKRSEKRLMVTSSGRLVLDELSARLI